MLWDMAAARAGDRVRHQREVSGARREGGARAGTTHDLAALRAILSTGSPLAPHSYDYVYATSKRDVHLASISGGTDIVSCFALGNPIGPVWRGELQTRGLGMAVEVFDEQGRPVQDGTASWCARGRSPACRSRSGTIRTARKYRAAYFDDYPSVWRHGDWADSPSTTGS